MKTLLQILTLTLLMACEKPPNLSGEWEGIISYEYADNEIELIITESKGIISGNIRYAESDWMVLSGSLKGDSVILKYTIDAGFAFTYKLSGKWEGNRIKGSYRWDGAGMSGVGEFCIYKKIFE